MRQTFSEFMRKRRRWRSILRPRPDTANIFVKNWIKASISSIHKSRWYQEIANETSSTFAYFFVEFHCHLAAHQSNVKTKRRNQFRVSSLFYNSWLSLVIFFPAIAACENAFINYLWEQFRRLFFIVMNSIIFQLKLMMSLAMRETQKKSAIKGSAQKARTRISKRYRRQWLQI